MLIYRVAYAVAVTLCCLLVISGGATGSATPKKNMQNRENCREIIRISRSANPWKGMTNSYAQEQENKNIKASGIGKQDAPIPGLEKYMIGGDQLMAIKSSHKKVVVNEKYFSDLKKADATNIDKGQYQKIGRYLDKSFTSMTPRKLASFLLDAQIITTYWHVESELCLGEEIENKQEYKARFTGRHIYYTNKREEQKLDFVIRIDRETGELTLLGNL